MWGNQCGASLAAPAARRRGFQGSAGVLGVLILYCTSIDKDVFFALYKACVPKDLLKIQNFEGGKKKKKKEEIFVLGVSIEKLKIAFCSLQLTMSSLALS